MCLAHAWRTEQENVLCVCDEASRRELADQFLIDRWLKLEVEILERLHRREVSDLDPHRDALLLLRIRLFAEDLVEEVEVRRLAARGLRENAVEPLRYRPEPELEETLFDARSDDLAHDSPPIAAA